MSDKRGFTELEAAAYIGVSKDTLRREVAIGNLPVRWLGAKKLYDRADLDRFFEALPPERA